VVQVLNQVIYQKHLMLVNYILIGQLQYEWAVVNGEPEITHEHGFEEDDK